MQRLVWTGLAPMRRASRCVSLASTIASRQMRTSSVALGGGGHHDGPLPYSIPQPQAHPTDLLGRPIVPRISGDNPYHPGKDDYVAYFGGVLLVVGTLAAVIFKSSLFASDDHHHAAPKSVPVPKEGSSPSPPEIPQEGRKVEKPAEKPIPDPGKEQPTGGKSTEPCCHGEKNEGECKDKNKENDSKKSESKEQPEEKKTHHADDAEPSTSSQKQDHPPEESSKATNAKSEKIPDFIPYLIIGAGTASYYAAVAIRGKEAEAKVLIIGDEPSVPYNRPPLSKELWWYADAKLAKNLEYTGANGRKRDIFLEADGFFVRPSQIEKTAHGGVSLLTGHTVKRVDVQSNKVYLDDGRAIGYGKLLIATGGKPKRLPELQKADSEVQDKILYFRNISDYRKLEELIRSPITHRITVIGDGFLGTELAYSIKRKYPDLEVHQVIKGSGSLPHVLPKEISELATKELQEYDVKIYANSHLRGAEHGKNGIILKVNDSKLETDVVVVAVGIEPNVELAKGAGLKVDDQNGGIVADSTLQAAKNVFVAGDVASFEDGKLGRRRAEHWDHAQVTGRLAGANMTGGEMKKFWYQPMWFTKLASSVHLSGVGNTNSQLDTITVYAKQSDKETEKKAVVFYKEKDDRIVGVLLLNMFGSAIDVARRLIDDKVKLGGRDYAHQLAKLFPLYASEADKEKEKEIDKEKK